MISRPLTTPPLATSLTTSSVFRFRDLDHLDAVYAGSDAGFVYARDGHPNAVELETAINRLHGGTWTVITPSGMAALAACFLGVVHQGDRILAADRLYGKTTKLLREEMAKLGVDVEFVDVQNLQEVSTALSRSCRLLIAETISNPTMRVAHIPALAELTRANGCLLLIDNTFATPHHTLPLELGADFVMESLTKLLGGHSDVTLGSLTGKNADLGKCIRSNASTWGYAAPAFDCWQAARGLETFTLRAQAACQNAVAAAVLIHSKCALKTLYPALADAPDRDAITATLKNGYGHMLAFEVPNGRAGVQQFIHHSGIPFCPSLGHTTTTLSHPATTSHRFETTAVKLAEGITDGLIRLSVGCEDFDALRHQLEAGIAASRNAVS